MPRSTPLTESTDDPPPQVELRPPHVVGEAADHDGEVDRVVDVDRKREQVTEHEGDRPSDHRSAGNPDEVSKVDGITHTGAARPPGSGVRGRDNMEQIHAELPFAIRRALALDRI